MACPSKSPAVSTTSPWCDVIYGPYRGWVYGEYLSTVYRASGSGAGIFPRIGHSRRRLHFANYWGRYYQGAPWWGQYGAGSIMRRVRAPAGPPPPGPGPRPPGWWRPAIVRAPPPPGPGNRPPPGPGWQGNPGWHGTPLYPNPRLSQSGYRPPPNPLAGREAVAIASQSGLARAASGAPHHRCSSRRRAPASGTAGPSAAAGPAGSVTGRSASRTAPASGAAPAASAVAGRRLRRVGRLRAGNRRLRRRIPPLRLRVSIRRRVRAGPVVRRTARSASRASPARRPAEVTAVDIRFLSAGAGLTAPAAQEMAFPPA